MKCLLAVVALAFVAGCISIRDSGATRALQSQSPNQMGTAIFIKDVGPQDSAVSFDIIDPNVGAKPINIGFVGDENWKGEMPCAAARRRVVERWQR